MKNAAVALRALKDQDGTDDLSGWRRVAVLLISQGQELAADPMKDLDTDESERHATGYNPGAPADDTVLIARVADRRDNTRLVIVNCACHPTTLAWDNTLLSPDFIGAVREVGQQEVGAPCCFFQAPCGELGPREGFVGDTGVADRNGRQLGHASLSGLYSMGPPRHDFVYQGPVESGATIGTWAWVPFDTPRALQASGCGGDAYTVDLATIDLPDPVTAFSLGEAVWITCSGEPYSTLTTTLRARFPKVTLMVSPVAGDAQIAYLLPRTSYGIGVYQEQPSSLAAGRLETLIDALTSYLPELTDESPVS